MPRKFLVCAHCDREKIDRDLVAGHAFRDLSKRFQITVPGLHRHKRNHLPRTLVKAREAKEIIRGETLLEQIEELKVKAADIEKKAEQKGDLKTALLAIRELTRIVELLAKLQGELKSQSVNVALNTQWVELRATMLTVLKDYPEAKLKLAEVLEHVG